MSCKIQTDNMEIENINGFREECQNDPAVINIVNEQSKNSNIQDGDENDSVSGNDGFHSRINWKKGKIIDDSDPEEESNMIIGNDNENVDISKNKKHKNTFIESDSEVEVDQVPIHNKSFSDDTVDSNEQPVFITNSEGQLVQENINRKSISQAMRLSALCDSESSEDEIGGEKYIEHNNYMGEEDLIPKQNKKQKPRENAVKKPKKMTGKEAAKIRTEIKSESQRMLREKNVSLPYHKPKNYTIKEFLSKRIKLSSTVPINAKVPPSVAIKMSAEQLTLVSKKLKEREKEMKKFYKSESESEDDDKDDEDKDYVPPSESISQSMNGQSSTEEVSGVTEVQVEVSSENKDVEQLQLTVTETVDTVKNSQIISEPAEEMVIETGNLFAGNVNITVCSDCDTAKNAETNNSSDKRSVDKLTVDQNISEIVTENLNDVKVQSGDNSAQNVGNNENIDYSETSKIDGSKDYDFNLDDLEANSENILGEENPTKRSNFEYTDLDKEIENFGSDNQSAVAQIEHPKNLSKLELIKTNIANIQPRLTGCPDDVIDLETGVAKPNEVTKLMKRFLEHNFKKPVAKNKVELSIISFESGEIHKETLAVKVDDESEVLALEEKPGAKLQKLRGELQHQMAQKRSEWWQKKTAKQSDNEEVNIDAGEKEDCVDEILDDEEEETEMTESSDSEEDEEEETNESIKPEKLKKSAFINEEAEESDEDNGAIIEATSEDEVANEADDENEIDDASECDENDGIEQDVEVANEAETQHTNKTFKKILKGFSEDSDEEELVSKPDDLKENENTITVTQEEDIFPPHQPRNCQTPKRPITPNKSDFEFLTPISYITGLQNLNSAAKNLKESPVASVFQNANEPSPLKEKNWQQNLQKKLFMGTEMTDSQVDELYADQFPETQESVSLNKEQVAAPHEEFQCTSNSNENEERLVDLCSGKFPLTEELTGKRLSDEPPSTQDLLNICSGEFTGVTQNETSEKQENLTKTPADTYLLSTNKEVKSLDEDQDMIISQLIDEEEMENFKKRFESPLLSNTQKRIVEEFQEAQASGGVIDSDDETDAVGIKKKNKKRIMFSDDEDSEGEKEEEEVIDLHDNIDDDEDSNIAVDNIAYDSEENEIELVDENNGRNMKPSDFFENEAELSESEWGSDDEDEKDLDTMEFEQGDAEIYDEKKIRTDLEKIHMRRLLDDDTREVKLLQEMLLEDGELHGSGRERQFKWKNIDSVAEINEVRKEDDDVYLEEEETEEEWRKKRHEREMFLKNKLMKSQDVDDDSLLGESQLLKVGQKVLLRSQSNSQNNTPVDKNSVDSESLVLKQSFTLSNKRGSFLSRNDQVLQRLAEYNKVTSVNLGTATAKNSRNFLFQTVTMEETADIKGKKRKASDGTPNVIKKLRLTSNLSPAIKKKPSAKTKLFGNW